MKKSGIILRLGAIVAYYSASYFGENKYTDDIIYRLKRSINRHPTFSFSQKKHLYTYLFNKLKIPENIQSVKNEIAALSTKNKQNVRRILINIAFADEKVTITRKKCITKLYVDLGFDEVMLVDDLNAKGLSFLAEIEADNVIKVDFSQQAKNRKQYAPEIKVLHHALTSLSQSMQNSSNNKEKCNNRDNDVIPFIKHEK